MTGIRDTDKSNTDDRRPPRKIVSRARPNNPKATAYMPKTPSIPFGEKIARLEALRKAMSFATRTPVRDGQEIADALREYAANGGPVPW